MKEKTQKTIVQNRKARYDYHIENTLEAGVVLHGWEVKSLRAGKGQLLNSFVQIQHGEAWLLGSHISPLISTSTHVLADPLRSKKLLLNRKELHKLEQKIKTKGYTLIALDYHWNRSHIKISLALAKGKQQHDKRAALKERQWAREQF